MLEDFNSCFYNANFIWHRNISYPRIVYAILKIIYTEMLNTEKLNFEVKLTKYPLLISRNSRSFSSSPRPILTLRLYYCHHKPIDTQSPRDCDVNYVRSLRN